MVQVSRRAGVTNVTNVKAVTGVTGVKAINGPALIRLLARLTDTDVPESKQAFADRLSQWVGWADAISLSAALSGAPAATPSASRASAGAEEGECTRVRTALANAITSPMETSTDFLPFRRRYFARQQAMETGIAPLRGHLRARLAARSPAMARLAAVDAVMEQALAPREDSLLSTVPTLLEKHFVRLRKAGQAPDAPDGEVRPGPWLEVFGKDMQGVLLAELDIRFQPLEGLLEALRMS